MWYSLFIYQLSIKYWILHEIWLVLLKAWINSGSIFTSVSLFITILCCLSSCLLFTNLSNLSGIKELTKTDQSLKACTNIAYKLSVYEFHWLIIWKIFINANLSSRKHKNVFHLQDLYLRTTFYLHFIGWNVPMQNWINSFVSTIYPLSWHLWCICNLLLGGVEGKSQLRSGATCTSLFWILKHNLSDLLLALKRSVLK